jgi:hypothetical protein
VENTDEFKGTEGFRGWNDGEILGLLELPIISIRLVSLLEKAGITTVEALKRLSVADVLALGL